jgi:hypothetical protein
VRISLLVKHFSVWISSSMYSQILAVYSVFSIQLRAVCRVWFSADTGDRTEQGTHTCFGSIPMDQALDLRVLCYLAGRIASPVGANVITITIFRSGSKFQKFSEMLYHCGSMIVWGTELYPAAYRQI